MKRKFVPCVLLLFLTGAIVISCKKNVSVNPRISLGNQQGSQANHQGPDVYVAVSENGKGKYWKNDSVFSLFNCGRALSIAVSGSDVYVSGLDAQTNRLAYWRNGVEVGLPYDIPYTVYPSTNHSISAGKLVVSGTDVYLPITELKYNWQTDEDTFSVASYLRNNTQVSLSNSLIYNAASSIAISDKGIYVTGTGNDINLSHSRAEYWLNGTPVYLSDSSSEGAGAQDIAISGNDVYILGTEEVIDTSNGGGVRRIVYWKNGDRVVVTDGLQPDLPTSMAVSGSDVYIAGTEIHQLSPQSSLSQSTAIYWKNGIPVTLSYSTDSRANSIAIDGQDVYVAGYETNGSNTRIAKYWKNGFPVTLSSFESEASSICVSK